MAEEPVVPEAKPITNENWHRIVGILLLKFGFTTIEILAEDVLRLGNGMSIVADLSEGKFVVRVMPTEIFELMVKEKNGIVI